jgi:hypothetical protein
LPLGNLYSQYSGIDNKGLTKGSKESKILIN